jgi:hypothetical protein
MAQMFSSDNVDQQVLVLVDHAPWGLLKPNVINVALFIEWFDLAQQGMRYLWFPQ